MASSTSGDPWLTQYHAHRTQGHVNPQFSTSERDGSSRTFSCMTCRLRKVKCDRLLPCTACRNSQFDCAYPQPKPQGGKAKAVANQRLRERLQKLENLVHDLEGHPTRQTTTEGGVDKERERTEASIPDLGRLVLVEGQSRYVENSLWVSLTNEVAGIRDLLDEDENEVESSPDAPSLDYAREEAYMRSYKPSATELGPLHPTSSRISILWQTFEENVDPIIKVLHKPSIRLQIARFKDGEEHMTRPFEALMFAMYFAAVTSMTEEQCQAMLETDRTSLSQKYLLASQKALAKASHLSVHNNVVLQALVIRLICELNHDDIRLVWTTTAVAIRIAQSLGIHRDGSRLGLSFFESEMRRRIWWQICILDVRTAENHGSNPSVAHQGLDTALPLNINDDDLDPSSSTVPSQVEGITDMTLSLVRYEILSELGKKRPVLLDATLCNAEADRITKECGDKLQSQYLRYCDLNIPFHKFIATFARMMLAKMWISIHHGFQLDGGVRVLPPMCKDRIFTDSLEVVKLCLRMEREESTKQWRWTLRNHVPWQAMVFLLSQICQREESELMDRAWATVQDGFRFWEKNAPKKTRDVLWANMNKLMAKARSSRAGKQAKVPTYDPANPGPDAASGSAARKATWADATSFREASNDPQGPWLGVDSQLDGWPGDFDDLENWAAGDFDSLNWNVE